MDKYNHLIVEKDIEKKWREKKIFQKHDLNKKPFCIILPPPNVTGKLHLGHAWDGYLQDTIIRYKKLQGFDTLFLPGMDHAGIATQAKVEQRLILEGKNKHLIGKEEFIKQTFLWKEEYAEIIHNQWAKLGLALDYSNERFTLDKESNEAVNKVFISLYNEGLIYRGAKAINWDVKLQTALSNIETISKEADSWMYYIKYIDADDKNNYLTIATTRPETIFSDVAIAFNPNDEKYLKWKNKKLLNPLNNKELIVICDEYIDPNFGSGCMKVSAHAAIDIDIINKNNLEVIECINYDGTMKENAMFACGLNRFDARKKVVEYLKEKNLLIKEEKIKNVLSLSERTNEVIEIFYLPQWFVKMDKLAKKILDNLDSKNKVCFFPQRFEQNLRIWMQDIHDWTISRQLWWGHQIPAWYKDNEIKVCLTKPGEGWVQDNDVLDTWFSSALCPFSFLGWPKNEEKLKRYFPTSLLVTGYDIIFFWVARMYFMSLHFQNQIPFKNVLIHGLIRDELGRKMSKSLNNGIDPMEVIDNYGSDALRWYLLTNSTPGNDLSFSLKKLESSWGVVNKIWNIAKYINDLPIIEEDNIKNNNKLIHIWLNNHLIKLKEIIDNKIEQYEFTIIGKEINNFIFNIFSSWYIEFLKVFPQKNEAKKILKNFLILIHPFFPFVSDYLFTQIFNEELLESNFIDNDVYAAGDIDKAISAIELIRLFREEYHLSNKEILNYTFSTETNEEIISLVNKVAHANFQPNINGRKFSKNDVELIIELNQEQKEFEKINLLKQKEKLENEIKRSENILSNEKFLKNANKNKIIEEKIKYNNYKKQLCLVNDKLKEV